MVLIPAATVKPVVIVKVHKRAGLVAAVCPESTSAQSALWVLKLG